MIPELYRHMMDKGVTADTRALFGIFDHLHRDGSFWMEGLHLFEVLPCMPTCLTAIAVENIRLCWFRFNMVAF